VEGSSKSPPRARNLPTSEKLQWEGLVGEVRGAEKSSTSWSIVSLSWASTFHMKTGPSKVEDPAKVEDPGVSRPKRGVCPYRNRGSMPHPRR
jgi:hypothetical protein